METTLLYLGRLLFGGYFIFNGINHFRSLNAMAGYARLKGTPFPEFSVGFSGLLLLVGGVSVLLNIFPVVGLIALVAFLIPVTFVMHAYWKVQDAQAKMSEMVNFMKNLALLGAVLIVLAQAIL
jgi:putative oxidoreductase